MRSPQTSGCAAIDGAHAHVALAGDAADGDAARRGPAGARGRMCRAAVRNSCRAAPQSRMRDAIEGEGLNDVQSRRCRSTRRCAGSRRVVPPTHRHSPAFTARQRAGCRPAVRAFGFGNVVALDRRRPPSRRIRAADLARPRAAAGGAVSRGGASTCCRGPRRSASSSIPPTRAAASWPAPARRSARSGEIRHARDGAGDRRAPCGRCPMAKSSICRVVPKAAPIRRLRRSPCSGATAPATCSSTARCRAR